MKKQVIQNCDRNLEVFGKKMTKKVKQKTTVLGLRIDHTKKLISKSSKATETMQDVVKYHSCAFDIINQGLNHSTIGHRDKIEELKKKFPVVSFDINKLLTKMERVSSPDDSMEVDSEDSADPEDHMQVYVQKELKAKI